MYLQRDLANQPDQVGFFNSFADYVEDSYYVLAILAISPFISRERFWHYLLAIQFANFVKVNVKMVW